ncbi:uncharacterized protein LOC100201739 isoform X2 [Hydra vulgaris]|uniref:uncharacterized protein LOC100201739 isoform X2 n=1 Tax=Hydra vulgaris TaxID=6087 RepID=UPI001F5F0B32|nr:uncharacterized protein LOC100201739 isoform X2 [Hydra vulgaris]
MITEKKEMKEDITAGGCIIEGKPGKLLRCPQDGCDKVFRSSPGYRYHLKSHALDPRPHLCQCCHKKFKSANGLKYHLRKAHHIEPVLSKHNIDANFRDSESISSEEEPFLNSNDACSRTSTEKTYPQKPNNFMSKSPIGFLSSMKNLPGVPSPLIKSPSDNVLCASSNSSGSGLQSPYTKIEPFSVFDKRFQEQCVSNDFSKRFGLGNNFRQSVSPEYFSRPSLTEYTQQCQQANNEFRQQCQRLSTGDIASVDYLQKNPRFYNCMKFEGQHNEGLNNLHRDFRRQSSYTYNDNENIHYNCSGLRNYPLNRYREFEPLEGKEYPANLSVQSPSCITGSRKMDFEQCGLIGSEPILHVDNSHFKMPNNVQNTEQIVPDINAPNQVSPNNNLPCDRNNNATSLNLRKTSDSSNETEFSDCVFQNESPSSCNSNRLPSLHPLLEKNEKMLNSGSYGKKTANPNSSLPLLNRRISRTKSIPPLFIQANPDETEKEKDIKHVNNKLLHLAEIATSPSPFKQSPLPLSLTPSILPTGTPDWSLKSPFSKIFFSEKSLSTPNLSRSDASRVDSLVNTGNSLPLSPFLDNVQTPSFWPTQVWPTPVWLCFLKGCNVKFELDDKEFMKTEDIAVFCTTPGGRRRDDMNFYTSGMKVREIKEEKPSFTSAREMVELTFEQIIPGPQRLVAKCPIDHPFFIKHKGWSAPNPTEAMARYGLPFKALHVNDICMPASRINQTPSSVASPAAVSCSSNGPQIFTFSPQDTSRFHKTDNKVEFPNEMKMPISSAQSNRLYNAIHEKVAATSAMLTSRSQDMITLTYSKSPNKPSFFPPRDPPPTSCKNNENIILSEFNDKLDMTQESFSTENMNTCERKAVLQKKRRRKPFQGSEQSRRPMNGFMLFGKSMRIELTKLYPGKDNRAISKLLGEKWRELSEEKREDFSRLAKEMADERMKLNPNCWKRKHRKYKDGSLKNCDSDPKLHNIDCGDSF